MASIMKVSHYLCENADSLAVEIVESVVNRMDLKIPAWEKEQAVSMYVELIKFFGNMLPKKNTHDTPQTLIEWSQKNSAQGLPDGKISKIVVRYPVTREILMDIITKISVEFDLKVEENAFMIKLINSMLDLSLNETVLAFERLFDQRQEEIKKEAAQLSAPIVPIKDGIIVLPLIGVIDQYRATYILEEVAPKIADLMADYVIIDFSGLSIIDVQIIKYLHQIESMFQLMGIQVIATGLRPDLVKIAVHSAIGLNDFKTYSTVKQALETIVK